LEPALLLLMRRAGIGALKATSTKEALSAEMRVALMGSSGGLEKAKANTRRHGEELQWLLLGP
jgi:hypothetical protein